MELQKLFDSFVQSGLFLKNWSVKTVRSYGQAFASYQQSLRNGSVPEAHSTEGAALTKAQLEAWIVWMRQRGREPGGCNVYIRAMNSFCSWLKEEGHIPSAIKLKLLKSPPKPLRGFSDAEVRLILAARPKGFLHARTWTMIQTLLDTGCRIDEVLNGLPVGEVDLDNLKLTVTGKGNKQRHVPMSFELRKVLFRYFQLRLKTLDGKRSSVVFCTRDGKHLSYRNAARDIKRFCERAGVSGGHVHPHSFRHYFACSYIRSGGDIYRLSRILGHTSISTTQLYLRSMGVEHLLEGHSQHSPLAKLA
jgi:integrase/recombinase XerD